MRQILLFYFVSEFFLSFGIGITQYAQPFYYASQHIGDEKIGYLFAINAFFGGCSALVVGPVADKIGATPLFKIGTFLIGFGALLTAIGTSFPLWTVTTAVSGIGGSMLTSTENVVLSSLMTKTERSHLISRFTALYMAFIGIGIVMAGFFVSWYGLRTTMFVGAGIALVAPIIRFFVQAPDNKRDRVFQMPTRPLIFMAIYAVLFGIAGGLFNPFATLILEQHYHATNTTTSIVYAVSIFMIAFGSFLVRPLIRRLKEQATLFVAFLLSALSMLLFIFAVSTTAFVAVYVLVTITTAVPPPVIDALFLNLVHTNEFSQMFGMRVFGTRVGNAIGSSMGGTLIHNSHYAWMVTFSSVFFLVAYGYLLVVRRPLLRRRMERQAVR